MTKRMLTTAALIVAAAVVSLSAGPAEAHEQTVEIETTVTYCEYQYEGWYVCWERPTVKQQPDQAHEKLHVSTAMRVVRVDGYSLSDPDRMTLSLGGRWTNDPYPSIHDNPALILFCEVGRGPSITTYVSIDDYVAAPYRSSIRVRYRFIGAITTVDNDADRLRTEWWDELVSNEGAWGGESSKLPVSISNLGGDSEHLRELGATLEMEVRNYDDELLLLSFAMPKTAAASIAALRQAC